jgi:transposase
MENVTVNAKEQRRIMVLTDVVSGAVSVTAAATCLQVSERHTKRLADRRDETGAGSSVEARLPTAG